MQAWFWKYHALSFGNESIYTGFWNNGSNWSMLDLLTLERFFKAERLLRNNKRKSKLSSDRTKTPCLDKAFSIGGLWNFHKRSSDRKADENTEYTEASSKLQLLWSDGGKDPKISQRGISMAATSGTCKMSCHKGDGIINWQLGSRSILVTRECKSVTIQNKEIFFISVTCEEIERHNGHNTCENVLKTSHKEICKASWSQQKLKRDTIGSCKPHANTIFPLENMQDEL